jgi:hypothetical protein
MAGRFASLILALAAVAGSALAQDKPPTRASTAADAFTLDVGAVPDDDTVVAPAEPLAQPEPSIDPADEPATSPEPAPAEPPPVELPVAEPVRPAAASSLFSLDTPIERLIADGRARAVLDKELPGLSTDENLPRFRTLSLRGFQPLTGGQLTDEILRQVESDLAAIKPLRSGKGRNAER